MALKYGGKISENVLADQNNTFSILLNLVGEGKNVCEIGCATGYMTKILHEHGKKVWGFEIDADAAVLASQFAEVVWVGDLEKEVERAQIRGKFDVILIGDVLEHLVSPSNLLKYLIDNLEENGRLIISMPNVAHWSRRIALLKGEWDLTDTGMMDRTHLRWFTLETGSEMINQCGYTIDQIKGSFVFPAHNRLKIFNHLANRLQDTKVWGWVLRLCAYQLIFVATNDYSKRK